MTEIICDSSSLISLSESCNVDALRFLKKNCGTRFLIPPAVFYECVAHPLHVKQYAFSAIRLKRLAEEKVLEVFNQPQLANEAKNVLNNSNNFLSFRRTPLKLLQAGEAECLALLKLGVGNALLVDEKTTRLLVEAPEVLLRALKNEYRGELRTDEKHLQEFRRGFENLPILRSTEILSIAFSKGFFSNYAASAPLAFHSALYLLQQKGCSISSHELDEYEEVID